MLSVSYKLRLSHLVKIVILAYLELILLHSSRLVVKPTKLEIHARIERCHMFIVCLSSLFSEVFLFTQDFLFAQSQIVFRQVYLASSLCTLDVALHELNKFFVSYTKNP